MLNQVSERGAVWNSDGDAEWSRPKGCWTECLTGMLDGVSGTKSGLIIFRDIKMSVWHEYWIECFTGMLDQASEKGLV